MSIATICVSKYEYGGRHYLISFFKGEMQS